MNKFSKKAPLKAGGKEFYILMDMDMTKKFEMTIGDSFIRDLCADNITNTKVYEAALDFAIKTKAGKNPTDEETELIKEELAISEVTYCVWEAGVLAGFFTKNKEKIATLLRPIWDARKEEQSDTKE